MDFCDLQQFCLRTLKSYNIALKGIQKPCIFAFYNCEDENERYCKHYDEYGYNKYYFSDENNAEGMIDQDSDFSDS